MDPSEITQIPPKKDEGNDVPLTMDEIVEFAENKLEEYGIDDQFEVETSSRMKRAVGRAEHKGYNPITEEFKDGKLKISSVWFDDIGMEKLMEEGISEDFAEDTVLHELAHCLDYVDRGTSDHSYKWKRKAREVGADPSRTCDLPRKFEKLIATWKKVCPNCGKVVKYCYKKPHSKKAKACGECCKKHNNGNFSEKYELEVKENNAVI